MEGEEEAHQEEAMEVVVVVGMAEARNKIVEASWFGIFLLIAGVWNFAHCLFWWISFVLLR